MISRNSIIAATLGVSLIPLAPLAAARTIEEGGDHGARPAVNVGTGRLVADRGEAGGRYCPRAERTDPVLESHPQDSAAGAWPEYFQEHWLRHEYSFLPSWMGLPALHPRTGGADSTN
ncbi:MAG: hypothetical protein AB7Q97_04755 [Gammaproteobacteria bacterium]